MLERPGIRDELGLSLATTTLPSTGKFDGLWRGINWSMNFYWDLDLEKMLD